MNRRLILVAVAFAISAAFVSVSASADQPSLWVSDQSLSGIADKAKIAAYLDDLKAHGVSVLCVRLPGANGDLDKYTISEAKSRGMKVMALLVADPSTWDKNAGWRKLNSAGKPVLAGGVTKAFCPNSPYWDQVVFPSLGTIASANDVDGFYLDTTGLAYGTDDACFCPSCRARFQKETGKALPLTTVNPKNWTDPNVKLHAAKRVAWLNGLYEKYAQEVEKAKQGASALLSTNGRQDLASDGILARHAARFSTYVMPLPADTPRAYAVSRNDALRKAKKAPADELQLARDRVITYMNQYCYYEFLLKLAMGDGGGKPMVPISRAWFGDAASGYMGPPDIEIAQMEAAIGAGAKGYCFSGDLAGALSAGKAAGTTWQSQKYTQYLKDLTSGERAKWIADMRPDSRVAILCDRDAGFWTGDSAGLLRSAGGIFAALQYWKKTPVSIISPSEPSEDGFGKTGYKMDPAVLKQYDLVIAAGLDYVCREDLQALRDYVDGGGHLMILGPIGSHGKFLAEPFTDDAYQILGITTVGAPEPSGFVMAAQNHPAFTVPGGFSGPMGTFRISDDKYSALSCEPKFDDGWEILAHEVNDDGKRPAILMKEIMKDNRLGTMSYVNSNMAAAFTDDLFRVFANLVVVTAVRGTSVVSLGFSETASINTFKGADGLTRYIHVFTPDGEGEVQFRIRADRDTFPVSGQAILSGGESKPIKITQENRDPKPWEMTIAASGNGILKLGPTKPPFVMIKLQYEKREKPK